MGTNSRVPDAFWPDEKSTTSQLCASHEDLSACERRTTKSVTSLTQWYDDAFSNATSIETLSCFSSSVSLASLVVFIEVTVCLFCPAPYFCSVSTDSPRLLAELMAEADLVLPRPALRFPMVVVEAQSLLMLILV